MNSHKHTQTVKPSERRAVITGKRAETPQRISIAFRIKLETKEALEKLSNQMNLSQTHTIEMVIGYFAHTSEPEVSRVRLETQTKSLERQLSRTREKLKKLNNRENGKKKTVLKLGTETKTIDLAEADKCEPSEDDWEEENPQCS